MEDTQQFKEGEEEEDTEGEEDAECSTKLSMREARDNEKKAARNNCSSSDEDQTFSGWRKGRKVTYLVFS